MDSQNQMSLVLRKGETARLIGVSIATLDRLRVEGGFIRPIELGKQAIGFLRSEVDAWVLSRPHKLHFMTSCEDWNS